MKEHELTTGVEVKTHHLADDGTFPNSRLPLLIYRDAFRGDPPDMVAGIEETFCRNNWDGTWRDGIYSFQHYHSTAHEVLGCYAGSARVQFGGKGGAIEEVCAGDVVIIPAGVAHKNLGASRDFGVVGAYPAGQDYDMNYGKRGERPRVDENIARVPLPESDPVFGSDGPLLNYWKL